MVLAATATGADVDLDRRTATLIIRDLDPSDKYEGWCREPTSAPMNAPTPSPTGTPTLPPTSAPTNAPTPSPTGTPTLPPSAAPTVTRNNGGGGGSSPGSTLMAAGAGAGLLALCLCGLCDLAVAYRAHRRGRKDMAKVRVKQRSDETTPCRACASSSSADEDPFEATAAAPAPAKGVEEKEEGGASSGASLSSSRDHSFASAGESKHGGDDAGSLEEWKYPRVSESAGRPSSMTADDASQSTLRARKTRDQAKKEKKNSAKDLPTTAPPPPGMGRLAPLAVSPSSAGNKAGGALPPLLTSPLSSPRGGAVGPAQVRAWAAVAEHMKAKGVDAAQVLKAVVRASGADTVTQV